MSEMTEKTSVRDLIGKMLQNNKIAMAVLLCLVASITVFDLVPAAWGVPVTLVLVWLISWLMRDKWSDLGVRRPQNWGKVLVIGLCVGIVSQLFAALVLIPLFQKLGIEPPDYSGFETMRGNIGLFLMYLTVSWTTAGFGEEVIYRGFLMGHLGRLLGDRRVGWGISLVVVSALFGLAHAYQGPMGMLLVAYSGLIYGTLYIASGFNLWYTIIAHGTADTFVFLLIFTGLAERFL